jgi:hypothetical protein
MGEMPKRCGQHSRAIARSRAKDGVYPQRVAPCDSLAFWRVCRLAKRNQLAWLVGFRAGYYGDPYVWPLGALDPHVWPIAFIEGRGYRERGQ